LLRQRQQIQTVAGARGETLIPAVAAILVDPVVCAAQIFQNPAMQALTALQQDHLALPQVQAPRQLLKVAG